MPCEERLGEVHALLLGEVRVFNAFAQVIQHSDMHRALEGDPNGAIFCPYDCAQWRIDPIHSDRYSVTYTGKASARAQLAAPF